MPYAQIPAFAGMTAYRTQAYSLPQSIKTPITFLYERSLNEWGVQWLFIFGKTAQALVQHVTKITL